jgi:hypothetical protein
VSSTSRRFAEKNAAHGKSMGDRVSEATTQAASRMEYDALSAGTGAKEYYLKTLDLARENIMAGFDFAHELAMAETPTQLLEAWSAHARNAFEAFSKQAGELSALAQRAASLSGQPVTNGFSSLSRRAE